MKLVRLCGVLLGCVSLACGSSDGPGSGAAGASSVGGASNSAGAAAGGASGAASSGPCRQQSEALAVSCGIDVETNTADCEAHERLYAGVGCQDAFDAWLLCTTKPGYDCDQDTGCESSQNGYFSCQSRAVQRTGCVRLGGEQDAMRCTDATKPYAFSCLSGAPASCTQVVTDGAGIWCCPQL